MLTAPNYFECDSLRLAVDAVNVAGGGDIELDAATYSLSRSGVDNTNVSGDLDIGVGHLMMPNPVSITGQIWIDPSTGRKLPATTIDAGILAGTTDPDRILHVLSSANVSLSNLKLINGLSNYGTTAGGGGVRNEGDLSMDLVILYDNTSINTYASEGGGGLYNAGTATLYDCMVDGNLSVEAPGGGISNRGTLTMGWNGTPAAFSHVTNNQVASSSGGGLAVRGATFIYDTDIGGNTADWMGGGVYVHAFAATTPILFERVGITESSTTGIQIGSGHPSDFWRGGAGIAFEEPSQFTVRHSSIAGGNTKGFGAGIYGHTPSSTSTAKATLEYVTLGHNSSVSPYYGGSSPVDLECGFATCELSHSLVEGRCASGWSTAPGTENFEDDAKGVNTCSFAWYAPANVVGLNSLGGNQTLLLQIGSSSAARDLVTTGTCPNAPDDVDQRGLPRVAPCDFGAYEP